jgi:fatty-acyl-CoA synthase
MNLELDWLKRWAMYSPENVAIRCADSNRSFSYRELYERSNMLAQRLKDRFGLAKGDRVAMLSLNEPEYIFLFFALQRIGAILVPVNFRFTAREVDHVLMDSGAKLLVYQEAYSGVVQELKKQTEQVLPFAELEKLLFGEEPRYLMDFESSFESACMILYTSGTTGSPKGALVTNKTLFWNSVNTGLRLNITQNDSTVIFHPMFHTSGWNVLTTPFFHHGARIVMLKKFEPTRVLELCDEERVSILFGVPTMMDMMARSSAFQPASLKSVRYAIVGGEPMPVPLIRQWAEKSIPVRQGYGLTEFGPNVFSLNEEHAIRKIGSIGFPNFYISVKIIDGEGQELRDPDQVGELCLRGPACTPGYWNNEKASAEAIRDGWFHTGDLVRRDEEGFFYVVGRKKDMFISGAENVYPAEIEQFLRTHKKIHEVAVIGVPDEKWGEVGKCFYSTTDKKPLEEKELSAFCLSGLAKYKAPKYFLHLQELPKGESGKILKKSLQ